MKNMKFLLQLMTGLVLSISPITSVVACNKSNNSTPDITTGVTINQLSLVANTNQTYLQLNNNPELIAAITSAINSAKNVAVSVINDYIITNDQVSNINQAVGTNVTFKVHAVGNQIQGYFSFIVTLSKPNISKDISIADPMTNANPNMTYRSLNTNVTITNLVVNAISANKGIAVTAGIDFILTNNQIPGNLQAVGQPVIFTVTAIGNQITGSFQFTDTLGKTDISSGITVADLQTSANPGANYGDLNNNPIIVATVMNAINIAKKTNITTNDFTLTNDQKGNQVVGQPVRFIVNAVGNQITGNFSFTDTLSRPDISTGVTVVDPVTIANPTATYSALNTNFVILSQVVFAINAAKNTTINSSDITLMNNQTSTANQVPGTVVTFTVSANPASSQIIGNFQFTDTLATVNVSSGVTVGDLKTAATTNATYASLNTNATITNAVATAINSTKGTNVTATDFTLTNNQTGNQVAGTPVIFTVIANSGSNLITGGFQFIDTLGKPNIATGVVVNDLQSTPITNNSYNSLNTNTTILATVINAINTAKNTSITANDITLTNNQIPNATQSGGTAVTFTVTAKPTAAVQGSFTFIDTLGAINISTGVTIADPQTVPDQAATYATLNSNQFLLNTINTAINTAKGFIPTAGTDYILTNNQNQTALQTAGTVITFTVTGARRLSGSFTFTDTMTKGYINGGVYVPDLKTAASAATTYGNLNNLTSIQNTINSAIQNYAKVSGTITAGTDYTLTNQQSSSGTPSTGTVVIFTVTATAGGKLQAGQYFTFVDTLS